MDTFNSRDEEIRLNWTQNQWLYLLAGFIGGVLFFPALQLIINNIADLLGGFVPEAMGILVTVLLIDRLNRRRDEENTILQIQEQMVRDAGSIVNSVANNAVHQLRKRGWLVNKAGLLATRNLVAANLQGAVLWSANLRLARLAQANLQQADLWGANLEEADLRGADLQGAVLETANLHTANLRDVNLQKADLRRANLRAADMRKAKLENANLGQGESSAVFDENTILPDGTHWTPGTDVSKFTN